MSGDLYLWSLASPYPRVLRGHTQRPLDLTFTADSRVLASCGFDGVRLWPLSPEGGHQRLIDVGEEYFCYGIAADATSDSLLVAAPESGAFLAQPASAPPRKLEGVPPTIVHGAALDTRAGLAAVGCYAAYKAKDMAIHVVDLESGATRAFRLRDHESRSVFEGQVASLGFAADGSLVSGGDGGVDRWNTATGERAKIFGDDGVHCSIAVSSSGRSMIAGCSDRQPNGRPGATITQLLVIDLVTGAKRRISGHGDGITAIAIDTTGDRIATGDSSGVVRIGLVTGEEPHLLIGHSEVVTAVAFSPDGRWLASASGTEILLWPMPDLSNPPLHTLPHDQLIAKLASLTNLRAVRDETSDTGWTIEIGAFPGWRDVPTW
jgi:WD40 repeat protein